MCSSFQERYGRLLLLFYKTSLDLSDLIELISVRNVLPLRGNSLTIVQ